MKYSNTLEAIAKGIETRLVNTVIVNIVTLETIKIARKLHIPEEEIQEWRSTRCCQPKGDKIPAFLKSLNINS